MNPYRIVYECDDGFKGEVIVYAANRLMAFAVFEDLGYEGVINADCYRVLEDE